MMANVQMGVLNLGINGGFLSNSPPNSCFSVHSFSNSPRPNCLIASNSSSVRKGWIFVRRKHNFSRVGSLPDGFPVHVCLSFSIPLFGIDLNSTRVKKSWDFDGRKNKFSVISALGNGEVETHSTSVQLVEKDLKFSPTFQDYLKVMESVRADRSKNPNENVDVVTPKKRSMGKSASHRVSKKADSRGGKLSYRDREKDSANRKHGYVERRGSGWGLVERILEKKTLGKSDSDLKNAKNSLNKMLNGNGDSVDTEHFDRERMGSTMWKEPRRDVGRADELRIPPQSKDLLESRCSDRFGEIKRVGNSSEKVYVKKANHVKIERGAISGNEMKRNEGEQLYQSKADGKMVEFENSKNSQNKKTMIRSNAERKSDDYLVTETSWRSVSFNRTDLGKKSDGSEVRKMGRNMSRMEQRNTEGNFNDRETDILKKNINRHSISRRQRLHDDARKTEKLGPRASEMQGRSAKSNYQLDKVDGGKNDGIDFEDRAAFRTFEVFTDIRNRPRVLRMELEERIQKLAKRLNATDVDMPEWQFSKMMHGAKIKFTEHSILRVVQILGALGNWKRALQVVQWLQSRERFKSYKSRYIYTTVLDVLGKAKRPVEALNIFYAMRQELSSYPDLAAYHCIAVTLGQAGLMKDLFDIIDCMRTPPEKKFKLGPLQKWDPRLEPDLVVYNAVLNACVQQKQWEGAFWVLQQLKQQNIRPTNTTYGLIMEVMLVCQKYNLVHEFFKKLEKTSIPSALNYKVLVNTLWREGKIDEAVLAVKDMERRGVVGSASLYYDLARCLCSAGRCRESLLQVDKICKVAKKPLVVTYTGLIQTCLDSGSIENGTYIFNEMQKFCAPNTITYNIMLKSYIRHGMLEEAKDLFQKILDGSHQIKSKYDSDQKAIPDKFTFNTMMDACAATNNWDDFEYTYDQMLHHGYHFDMRRHLRLVLDAFRAGKPQVIETTWDHLFHFGRAPPPPIIQERFCIKLQEDDHLAAISCIEVHQESDMHAFSEKAWLNILHRNAHRFKDDTIFRLTHKLNHLINGSDGPYHMYRNLLNACTNLTEITNHASTRS